MTAGATEERPEGEEVILDLRAATLRRGALAILDGIDLRVHSGEHWVVLGPNGAGKSTILKLCGAMLHPTSGSVEVLGHRLGRVDLRDLRRRIGQVDPRHPVGSSLTVDEVLLTGITATSESLPRWTPSRQQRRRTDSLVDRLGLADRRTARWSSLSQGERGRALIGRALNAEPELLLLDEPTTGLDVAAREQLLSILSQLPPDHPRLALVLVTHHLEEIPTTTTHALVVAGGRVVSVGPLATAVTSDTISEAFRHPIQVRRDADGRWSARAEATSPA